MQQPDGEELRTMLTEEASRLSRGHIRFFASVERAGPWFYIFMSVFPILVNLAWVGIYFVERDNDVFRVGGACSFYNRSQLFDGPSPFFITTRSTEMWQLQTLFAMLNAFLWAPFRYLRTGLTKSTLIFLMVIELLTVFPFLFSLVFFPAYVAYVPTYLRGFIMKHEILFVMSKEGFKDRGGNRMFLTWNLMLDLFSTMITVIGVLEWAQNNFPSQNHDALWGQPDSDVWGCYSFFMCIYWFIVTISTVGYGDIVPLNNVARLIIVLSIAFCLLFLPQFINRVTAILSLSADLREVHLPSRSRHRRRRDFVLVDGYFSPRAVQLAQTLWQPKFHLHEFAVKNLVVVLADPGGGGGSSGGSGDGGSGSSTRGSGGDYGGGEGSSNGSEAAAAIAASNDELVRMTADQRGLFCELFLMQGRVLQTEDGLQRSHARDCKTLFLLPRLGLARLARVSTSTHSSSSLRESRAESREYCLRRDFDQIKRLGGLKNRIGSAQQQLRLRTVLFHHGNRRLVGDFAASGSCCCPPVHVLSMDQFGQRMAASTVLVPGFNTLWAVLMLSGSVTDKTFSECDAEADGERIVHRLPRSSSAASSSQHVVPVVDDDEEEDDEEDGHGGFCIDKAEYVLGLHRNTLLLAEFTGGSSIKSAWRLRDLCARALEQRVLVLAFVRREHVCAVHMDFRGAATGVVHWGHDEVVRQGDYLVCFGEPYQIAVLSDPESAFWGAQGRRRRRQEEDVRVEKDGGDFAIGGEEEEEESAGIDLHSSPETTTRRPLRRRQSAREGEFAVAPASTTIATRFQDQFLADARAPSEMDDEEEEEDKRAGTTLPHGLRGHVIVYAASHVSFVYFVRKLRSEGLGEAVPILLMDPKPPSAFPWSEVSGFPNVYFVQGSPFILDDLVRAGFEHARCLVLLVDFRARYEAGGKGGVDEDNLLAERVACRLRRVLQCPTRIITHLVKEDHFEYIEGTDGGGAVGGGGGGLAGVPRLEQFASLMETVWPPIQSATFVCGECFFPGIFLPMFVACESRGNWLGDFLDALGEVAGLEHGGLELVEVKEEEVTYAQLAKARLASSDGLAIGLFRNYHGGRSDGGSYRGVLLFPSNDVVVRSTDRLFVLGGGRRT